MLRWQDAERRYTHGEDLFAGKWFIGSVLWDAVTRDADPWWVHCRLPGIKERIGPFASIEEGKERLERVAQMWFDKAKEVPE